jgi:hypothetical protein
MLLILTAVAKPPLFFDGAMTRQAGHTTARVKAAAPR